MRMQRSGAAAAADVAELPAEVPGDRTVVVGVKLDPQSRELLTWALVKVAEPGDRVVALHVLGSNEIVDRDGKSSLLSLVKAFDSVLAVYEGFCNLKQVDLKLKICRGTSVRKILVREAKSYGATRVIVGTARNHHPIRPSTSVAKYCAKKLPKDCWVLAVDNGKVIFQREGSPATFHVSQGKSDNLRPNSLLNVFHRSISKNSKVLNDSDFTVSPKSTGNASGAETLEQVLLKASADAKETIVKHDCSICASTTRQADNSCDNASEETSSNHDEENSLAIIPLQTDEATSGSVSPQSREMPAQQPGWPLLRCAILADRQTPDHSSGREISVVQWVMRLPSRHFLFSSITSEQKQGGSTKGEQEASSLDEESGALVLAGNEAQRTHPPDESPSSLPKELEGLHEKYSSTCRLFTYDELQAATTFFLAENLIGKGGSSQVYKGCLPDGKELAVKILKRSEDALKEFILEIEIITTLHHKNIVSLIGFCFEDNHLLLVYDFLSRGSLEDNLYGIKKNPNAFGWRERYRVALGVAEALEYLHERSAQPVIHRDVKSSNILLSEDFEPQLCDFGLAEWASTSSTYITCTDVAGTFGYLAPEYFMYGKVNDKVDVYAYGVVLLELLSGRKPISNDFPNGQESLVMWARPILNGGKISELLDPSLGENYDHHQLERMVLAATLCVRRAPRARPQMNHVVKLLHGDADIVKWARLQVSCDQSDVVDDEACAHPNIQSHLNLALHDMEDDSSSVSIIDSNVSLEDYLKGRWSRSSSFD
ncbi:protein kinase STUNTED isoform X2 [Syzygium oleosum]|uniref:protein kinase STUNTED isoform X2 n=1 Tax=Syzygium oleosum TaxID=219896 RepID=UPI0024BBB484|nr:protein kinase STUNTED isoform X2 [Syzygium oleosum]